MKKRLFSILTALCLCLTLLPTAAFATEDGGAAPAEPQQEQREEVKPKADPEQRLEQPEQPEAKPAQEEKEAQEEQEAQSEGEPVVLNNEGETVIELTQSNISNYMSSGLIGGSYQLGENVTITSGTLKVAKTVTLDLNGYTLTIKDPSNANVPYNISGKNVYDTPSTGILAAFDSYGNASTALTLTDNSEKKNGVLDVQGTDAIGIYVGYNCTLNIEGGTITDSTVSETTPPTGTGVKTVLGTVNMNGGSITNQVTGVKLNDGTLEMTNGTIENCAGGATGGGVLAEAGYIGSGSTITMTGGTIRNCNATWGGGVYVGEKGTFTMSGGSIENCKASSEDGRASGGGIYNAGRTTLSGTAKIRNCQAANAGGGIYDYSILNISDNVEITGCTAPLWSAMIVSGTISGGTFNGTVTSGGTITGGTFNGEVRNVGTITGGTFNSQVTNPGRITGGTFKGGITGTPALATGSGTEDDPYQIGTAIGLEWFRDKVNDASSIDETKICAELTADIDLENEAWTPIGNTDKIDGTDAYSGTFNGKGHTISGLNVTGEFVYAGLFSAVKDGTIRNLTVAGNVSSNSSGGAAGGIVGYASNATIENCSNHCNVAGNRSTVAGGIVGFNVEGAKIIDCYNVGKITVNTYIIGGIAGHNTGTISNCYNVGTVPNYLSVGEIVSYNSYFGTVKNCYYLNTANNGAVGDNSGTVTDTDPKSTAEFADGTVLTLLKAGERGNNADPWADTCQYVDAAGLTLPVFKNQNTHTHNDPLTHVLAKDPTTSEVGNIEYWYCAACGRYFADSTGAKEITKADTVIPKRHFSGSSSSSYPITVPDKTENGSVAVSPKTASKGSTVTISVTPDSGYVLETISVTDKNGNDLKLTDKGNGKYTFTMPGGKVEVKVTFMEDNSVLNFFYDVPNDAYYYEAVKWAAENGITGGIGNSLFAPNQPCTRAQIVTFLWRAAGSPVVNYLMPFTDVDEGAYYAEAVRWAASTGIVTGLTETTFGANGICTRAQAAAMIYRYAQAQGKGFTGAWMFLLPFTDVPEWAYESVAWCYMNGVTAGVSETAFAPGNDCTRAQIVTFLYRAYQGN